MENISDWLLNTIREDEKRGVMSGWIEEKRFLLLPHMVRLITHILQGRSVIVLTDRQHQWFGTYITQHINQHHKGRPFLPVIEITHLRDMIDSNAQGNDMKGFKLISNMLDMMYGNYKIWYIGKRAYMQPLQKSAETGGTGYLTKMKFLTLQMNTSIISFSYFLNSLTGRYCARSSIKSRLIYRHKEA